MKRLWMITGPLLFSGLVISALVAQRAFREYPSVEYGGSIPLPLDYKKPAEWTFARLMFPPGPLDGYAGRFDGPWQQGLSLWTQDYPRADRAIAQVTKTTAFHVLVFQAESEAETQRRLTGDNAMSSPVIFVGRKKMHGTTLALGAACGFAE